MDLLFPIIAKVIKPCSSCYICSGIAKVSYVSYFCDDKDIYMVRKAVVLLSFIMLFCISGSFGQGLIDFGMKGGYTSNKLKISMNQIEEELSESFHAGIFARLNGKRIFLQPEAYFINKGGFLIEDPEDNGNTITSEFDFETLDFPLLLGIYLINRENINLRIMAGPAASIVLNSDFHVSQTFESISMQSFEDALWSLQAGVGLDIFNFTLDLRSEAGLTDLSLNNDFDIYHRTINISLGIKIL